MNNFINVDVELDSIYTYPEDLIPDIIFNIDNKYVIVNINTKHTEVNLNNDYFEYKVVESGIVSNNWHDNELIFKSDLSPYFRWALSQKDFSDNKINNLSKRDKALKFKKEFLKERGWAELPESKPKNKFISRIIKFFKK